jgi:hypothetical protein
MNKENDMLRTLRVVALTGLIASVSIATSGRISDAASYEDIGGAKPAHGGLPDLSPVPPSGAKVAFATVGLPDPAGALASFTVPFVSVGVTIATPLVSQAGAAAASPRYVYGPGSSGVGYYQLASQAVAPAAATARTVQAFPGPRRQASTGRSGGRVRDWTTGHSLPSGGLMSKPWLKPSR